MENTNPQQNKPNDDAGAPHPPSIPNNGLGHFTPAAPKPQQHPIQFGAVNPQYHHFNLQHQVAPAAYGPGPAVHPRDQAGAYVHQNPNPAMYYNAYGQVQNSGPPGMNPHLPRQYQPPNHMVMHAPNPTAAPATYAVTEPPSKPKKGRKKTAVGEGESGVEVGKPPKGKGHAGKRPVASEPDDSESEFEGRVVKAIKKTTALKVPAKAVPKAMAKPTKYGDNKGKTWTDEETMILLDFFLAPERVESVTVDATRFITKLVEMDTLERDFEPIRSRWNYLLGKYKDAVAARKHTGGGDGDAEREPDTEEGKNKLKEGEKFLAGSYFARMDKVLGTRADIVRGIQLNPSQPIVASDEEAAKRLAKKQRVEDPTLDAMMDAMKESVVNSKQSAETNTQRLALEHEQLALEKEKTVRENERYLAEQRHLDDVMRKPSIMAKEDLILSKLKMAKDLKEDPDMKEEAEGLIKEAKKLRQELELEKAM